MSENYKSNETQAKSLVVAWKTIFALCIGFFMLLVDQTVVSVAIPDLKIALGASLNSIVWVNSIYLITFAVPLLFTGRLGDRYGQRTVYLWGITIFTFSSLWCALSQSVEILIAARAVQGIGASFMSPQTMSVINRVFPRQKIGVAMGVWGAVAGIATIVGPIIGGLVVGLWGWKWIFAVNVPFGLLSFILVMKWVPALPKHARSIDLWSVIASVVVVFCIVFGLQQGPKWHWPLWIWGLIIISIIFIGGFIWLQTNAAKRSVEALMPLGLFWNRNFSLGTFAVFTLGFSASSFNLPVMLYLQQDYGVNATKAGIFLVPLALASLILAPLAGKLADTIHPAIISGIGFGTLCIGFAISVLVVRDGWKLAWLCLPMVVIGVGSAFAWTPIGAASMRAISPKMAGAASGVYNTSRQIGSVLGVAMVGASMQIGLQYTSHANAMGNSLIIPTVVLIAGIASVASFRTCKMK